MSRSRASNRGQALVIFVFALIGLIGMTGLAIDGGMIFSDRRHAQNAADTAALAAAIVKIDGQKNNGWSNADCTTSGSTCNSELVLAALDRAASNGYSNNITDSTVEVHVPPVSGPYSDCTSYSFSCQDYVQVIIQSNVDTFFAKVLGIFQMHNQVEAVALARYAPRSRLYGGNALVELKPGTNCNASGDFVLGGSGTVQLIGGGIWVNSSCQQYAFTEGSNCIDLIMDGVISLVGGNGGSSCEEPRNFTPVTTPYPFPPEDLLPQPPECSMSGFPTPTQDGNGYWHYYPGYYSANFFPPERNAILEPGIYCVENVVKTTNSYDLSSASGVDPVTGYEGVLIWIKNNGYFSLQGGSVKLKGISQPTTSPYFGYLIYVDSDFVPWGDQNCTLNGGSDDAFTGVIYAPNCNVTINGGSMPNGYYSQVISYTLKLNGSTNLLFTYDENMMPSIPEVRDTGLYR